MCSILMRRSQNKSFGLPSDDICQMVESGPYVRKDATRQIALLRFVVFEFDVQTILDADLHLDRVVTVW
jgi:hypothetical protein